MVRAGLWPPRHDPSGAIDLAAAVPMVYWGSFLPAALVRGTGVDYESHLVGRILGIRVNLFYATMMTALALVGWLRNRRAQAVKKR